MQIFYSLLQLMITCSFSKYIMLQYVTLHPQCNQVVSIPTYIHEARSAERPILFKVSSQSRKSEFRVFSIAHLNMYNF